MSQNKNAKPIKITMQRKKDDFTFDPTVRQEGLLAALWLLVGCELGYGGQISRLENSLVEVKTEVMRCFDTTIFEGEASDMAQIVAAAAAAQAIWQVGRAGLFEVSDKWFNSLPESARSNCNFWMNALPLVVGQVPAVAALIAAAGITDVENAKKFAAFGASASMAVVRLMAEGVALGDAIGRVDALLKLGFRRARFTEVDIKAEKFGMSFGECLAVFEAVWTTDQDIGESSVDAIIEMSKDGAGTIADIIQTLAA
jgi:hypothetical protein